VIRAEQHVPQLVSQHATERASQFVVMERGIAGAPLQQLLNGAK
jgi:hypothetical protein